MTSRSNLSRSLQTNRGLEKLEPYEGKLSCTVLRGERGSNAPDLPDRPYNPSMEFISGSYPYPIERGAHDRITFFLQEPYYVATERTQALMTQLISECAAAYPERIVQYRIHPESRLANLIGEELPERPNIVDVTSLPIEAVYASTRVAVAHYSSTIMECIAHGCCPLVFNPSPSWQYSPDLESSGLGFMSTDRTSFFSRMDNALNHYVRDEVRKRWFG